MKNRIVIVDPYLPTMNWMAEHRGHCVSPTSTCSGILPGWIGQSRFTILTGAPDRKDGKDTAITDCRRDVEQDRQQARRWKAPAGVGVQTGPAAAWSSVENLQISSIPLASTCIRKLPISVQSIGVPAPCRPHLIQNGAMCRMWRTTDHIERASHQGIQRVFEPNDHPLWAALAGQYRCLHERPVRAGLSRQTAQRMFCTLRAATP